MIEHFFDLVKASFPNSVSVETIDVPPTADMGDLTVSCYSFAKKLEKSPVEVAQELKEKLVLPEEIDRVEVVGPYLNFFFNKTFVAKSIISKVNEKLDFFGSSEVGKGKTIVIDYSSPNIAKPFGIGHLRSTIIGRALKRMYEYVGYTAVGVNHLGDWGTQYGKLVIAWQMWGEKDKLDEDPIGHLYSLYVKFHEEEEINPELTDKGREAFSLLEKGDKESLKLWELFRESSLEEFKKYYEFLDVQFESYHGEAFYNDKIPSVIEDLEKTGKLEKSEGALVVPIAENKPPLIAVKSDGGSTYAVRDLATATYRIKEYDPIKILYVVGSPQKLHFEQLFVTLGFMGHPVEKFEHVEFGHFRFPDGKMSTRKGNIVFLQDVLDKSIELALATIEEKNPSLKNKEEVAKQVGLGAVVFADLFTDRIRDIIFDWDRIMAFDGETGPYLQYTHARLCSILRKVSSSVSNGGVLSDTVLDKIIITDEKEFAPLKKLLFFEQAVQDSIIQNKPSVLARYLIDLAKDVNEFYQNCPVGLADGDVKATRLKIVDSVRIVLKQGLSLLGIQAPEEM